jgi:RNA polymerase sigma factor (sigma-70 family)
MSAHVTTRLSLLLRIRDAANAEAWTRFVQIYAPMIHRFGIRRGLQDADAADLTQDVLRAVSHSIEQFEYDPAKGKFRCWLLTIARYTMCRMHELKNHQPIASGDSAVRNILEASPTHDPDMISWDNEYTRRTFELAAEKVRGQVEEVTWLAFSKTAIEQQDPATVARELGVKVGTIYVSRSRVLARMQKAVSEIEHV